jgi:transposase
LNVLKSHLRITIETLLAKGASQHEIARRTGVDRKTVRRYQANSPMATGSGVGEGQNPPPRPPALPKHSSSACEPHRAWIEAQVGLGRNATSIYQDLVELFGFEQRYNSVKRFVRGLKARDPDRFDVLESLPGEEAQVDFGLGAPTRKANGRYGRPSLFVMTLKYSGKSFRKVVWTADQESWGRLHEEAFRTFGGSVAYAVLDNLKSGVIRPDLYEPELNPVYAAMLAHYGVVADTCRISDPNRKGTVENAIQHTQDTALMGRRFDSVEAQNDWLAHWEERWAAPRIHGRKKRQVLAMFEEEPAWSVAVAWTDADNSHQVYQDQSGRLWDVLFMAAYAVRAAQTVDRQLRFSLQCVPRDGHATRSQSLKLKLVAGPGDRGEAVITIMLPDED